MKRLVSKGDIYKATGIIKLNTPKDAEYLSKGDMGIFVFKCSAGLQTVKGLITDITLDDVNTEIKFGGAVCSETLDIYDANTMSKATVTWSTLDNCWSIA